MSQIHNVEHTILNSISKFKHAHKKTMSIYHVSLYQLSNNNNDIGYSDFHEMLKYYQRQTKLDVWRNLSFIGLGQDNNDQQVGFLGHILDFIIVSNIDDVAIKNNQYKDIILSFFETIDFNSLPYNLFAILILNTADGIIPILVIPSNCLSFFVSSINQDRLLNYQIFKENSKLDYWRTILIETDE